MHQISRFWSETPAALSLITASLFLAACGSQPTQPQAQPERQLDPNALPLVYIEYGEGSDPLFEDCMAFAAVSAAQDCKINDALRLRDSIANSLIDQEMLFDATLEQNTTDWRLEVATAVYASNQLESFDQKFAGLAGRELLDREYVAQVELSLYWDDYLAYRTLSTLVRTLGDPEFDLRNLADEAVIPLVETLQQGRPEDFLYRISGATDYRRDMRYPEQIGDYYLQSDFLLPHPHGGFVLAYQHRNFSFDYLEVRVAPVRRIYWDEGRDYTLDFALQSEQALTRLELIEDEVDSIDYTHLGEIPQQPGYPECQGALIEAVRVEKTGDIFDVTALLFTREDKLLSVIGRFIRTENRPDVIPQICEALGDFEIPPESDYMRNYRERRLQQFQSPG